MYFPGYRGAESITPHNTTDFARGVCNGIYVGVSGDVAVVHLDGTVQLYKAAPVGILPAMATRVNSTGTTATNLLALYA
jgi:hypothetical protein